VFLCEDIRDVADVEGLATRIDNAFSQPFLIGGTSLIVAASVGMAFSGLAASISEHLIIEADKAMYQAKRKGGAAHQIIDLRKATETTERNSIEHDLRRAFAARELNLAYQPIVQTADGLVTGVEALLRWTHPTSGAIPPLTMIQIAEESELINQIGLWVLEQACTDRGGWLRDHPASPLELAVNVSSRQLSQPGFCDALNEIIDRCEMDPTALILELTENIAVGEGDEIAAILVQIKGLGVRLAMDDFGTGYSSLRYLQKLPIDIVKIDQGFIFDIGRIATGHAVVTAVAGLAQLLGLSVTAEGVETVEQRDAIQEIGCDSSQGYFYARPMSSDDILALLDGQAGGVHLPNPRRELLMR
jgi:EAL domain-containing protein (putative c-di-GMP-specific phosphodiesterase class I)